MNMKTLTEKERRKQILKEIKRKETNDFLQNLPIDRKLILELFDYLDTELDNSECNHDYTNTNEFLKSKNIDIEIMYDWLQDNGGYCDCEILCNIQEKFQ